MKIKIVMSEPKAGGGRYEVGEIYEFPDDVAGRWIAQGKAIEAVEKRKSAPKRDKPETAEEI